MEEMPAANRETLDQLRVLARRIDGCQEARSLYQEILKDAGLS